MDKKELAIAKKDNRTLKKAIEKKKPHAVLVEEKVAEPVAEPVDLKRVFSNFSNDSDIESVLYRASLSEN